MEFVRKNKNKKKSNSSSLKVVYISSPMKVKTTASKFRSLVQALTGRDSDITKSMGIVQSCNTDNNILPPPPPLQNPTSNNNLSKSDNILNEEQHHHHQQQQQHNFMDYFSYPILDQTHDSNSPTSSDSLIDQQSFGGGEPFGMSTQVEEDQYLQLQDDVFTSSLFTDQFSLQGHLIGCYDAL